MASDERNKFVRDNIFRITREPLPDEEAIPTSKRAFSLNEDDLTWLDINCLTLQNNGWHSATRSTLIRALIRSVSPGPILLDKVANEDELVDALRQAVKEPVASDLDESKDASIPARLDDVDANARGPRRIKLAPAFLGTFGAIFLILSVVSAFYALRGAPPRDASVQPTVVDVVHGAASPFVIQEDSAITMPTELTGNNESTSEPTPLPSPSATATGLSPATPATMIHVVQPGETLSGIANDYNVSLNALLNENGIDNRHLLTVGEKLIIPR